MSIENVLPVIIRSIAPTYSGKGCIDDTSCPCGGDLYDDFFESYGGGAYLNVLGDVLGKKSYDSFSNPIKEGIELISIEPHKAIPFGSFVYKAQPFPGDIDLNESFRACCSEDEVIKLFEKLDGRKRNY
jgi:hypothetical protein